MSRYFYELQLKSLNLITKEMLEFTGLDYNYDLFGKYSIGFIIQDYGSNTLFWIMYINCV